MAERTCSNEGCDKRIAARRLCKTHYSRWRRATLADPVAAEAWRQELRAREVALAVRHAASEKACSKCHRVQAKTEFPTTPSKGDGRHSWCKGCLRVLAKANYDSARARERHQRKANDPRYRAARKATYDRWRKQHPDRAAAATRRWRARRREHVKAVFREWEARNREERRIKRRGYGRARSYRLSGARVDYFEILLEHGMTCHLCCDAIASSADLHFDHVVPLARGGQHAAENIRPSHATCNLRKGARIA